MSLSDRLNGKTDSGQAPAESSGVLDEILRTEPAAPSPSASRPESKPPVSPAGQNGQRDPKGRFGTGNAGGPGRPKRAVEQEYANIVADVCDLATFRRIIEAVVGKALIGDLKAIDWVSNYFLGREKLPLCELAAWERASRTAERDIELAAVQARLTPRMQEIENLDCVNRTNRLEEACPPGSLSTKVVWASSLPKPAHQVPPPLCGKGAEPKPNAAGAKAGSPVPAPPAVPKYRL